MLRGDPNFYVRNIPASDPYTAVFERTSAEPTICNHSRRTISVRRCCRSLAARIVLKRFKDSETVTSHEARWGHAGRSLSSAFIADLPSS
jgi:hypothetical protein